jgi:riboflavin transporter FmnP
MRPELKYGLITGLGVCLWIATEYFLGLHTTHLEIGEFTGYFANLVPLVTLLLLLREKQKQIYDHRLTLGQGIAAGLLMSFVAAVLVYIFMLAYNRWINPYWLDNALEWKVARMRDHAVSEVDIRKEITFYRNANSPIGLVVSTILGMTAVGGLLSIPCTLYLRYRVRSRAN